MAHVVYYDAAKTPDPNNHYVQHFSHAFFATLRNKSATVPEVRAACMRATRSVRLHSSFMLQAVSRRTRQLGHAVLAARLRQERHQHTSRRSLQNGSWGLWHQIMLEGIKITGA